MFELLNRNTNPANALTQIKDVLREHGFYVGAIGSYDSAIRAMQSPIIQTDEAIDDQYLHPSVICICMVHESATVCAVKRQVVCLRR